MPDPDDVKLPAVIHATTPALSALTEALGVPREILASDGEIASAWQNLPGVLQKIPPDLRSEGLARMCVAVSAGLFDSAINYVWNCAVTELRQKVRRFGLNVVQQVVADSDFDENKLVDLKDAELLTLCLKLNLVTEDGYFFLDQCRDIRNSFSAAHPAVGQIDDHEFLSFTNRCAKYALANEISPVGVDISAFVTALKLGKFNADQEDTWCHRLAETHEAQRELLFGTLHGVFCDPGSSEETRLNSVAVAKRFAEVFTPSTKSDLIDRHQDYIAKGDEERHKASQVFFERLSMLGLLGAPERHALISNTCKKLMGVHQSFHNFYNEPPFAERLEQISTQGAVPDTAKDEFVTTVVTCGVGNAYGTSHAAWLHYRHMVQNFSPAEVAILLSLPASKTVVGNRIATYARCKKKFKVIVSLLDAGSVPTVSKSVYEQWRPSATQECS